MEKNKKVSEGTKVSSRNRNKNRNKTLQNRVKVREEIKKEKAKKLALEVDNAVSDITVDVEEVALRDNIVVVPERKVVNDETILDDVVVEEVLEKADSDDDRYSLEEVDYTANFVDEEEVKVEEVKTEEKVEKTVEDEDDSFVSVEVNKFRFVEDVEDKLEKTAKFKFVDLEKFADNGEVGFVLEEFHNNEKTECECGHECKCGDACHCDDNCKCDDDCNCHHEDEVDYNKEVKTRDVRDELILPPTDKVDIEARRYISFEKRVIALVVVIILCFFLAGTFIFKSINKEDSSKVTYNETSDVEYNVCINETYDQYYSSRCLDENMEYLTSVSERIPTIFNYSVDYNQSVDKKLDYYVVSKVVISKDVDGKVLNTMEDVLVDRTKYNVFGNSAEFAVEVDIPIKKYVEYVNNYNTQFGITSYATLEVIFYVDNGNTIKRASTLAMPISTTTYNIEKTVVDNKNQDLEAIDNSWNSLNTSYAVVGLIFVLFGLLSIIKLADLIYKVMGSTSMYQRKLNKILREYDRYIVIARSEYNVDTSKKLIKVASFGELLDARDALEKPIVYLKVNSVKSEFYVEDSEAIYKFVLKEADFEGK